MRVRVVMLLLAAGAAAAQTAAPTPQGNAGVIRVNVREVMVPVIVTDQKGHHCVPCWRTGVSITCWHTCRTIPPRTDRSTASLWK
jgi:hypothetical protein